MKLNLTKPLVFFDLETTGVQVGSDRIVEICLLKVEINGEVSSLVHRVNPGMTIPQQSIDIHGITDEMVRDKPTFKELAAEIANYIGDSDLAGYNSNHFDLPLLAEEMMRAGVNIDLKKKKMVDVFTIFQRQEPRNLVAAYKFYCGKDLTNAHSADADTMATYEVLMAQLEKYDIPVDVDGLAEFTAGNTRLADFAGRIAYDAQGVEVFNFGKYKGQRVADVFRRDPGYYGWIQNGDFPQYTKNVFTRLYLSLRK